MSKILKNNGFTLAETMIVVVVLGIIATLTIPALVNKNKESVAKTKVRKAMAAYESALNKMIIENDLKSDDTLTAWAGNSDNGCANSTNYFKKVQGDGCIFKTSDGIWWDISNIERPLIAFKQDDLITEKANAANDKTAFVLVGRFGNDGSLRVDDLAYETTNDTANSKAQVEKLYSLLGLKSSSAGGGNEPQSIFSGCDPTQLTCTIDGITYTRGIIEEDLTETYCTYNEETDEDNCDNISTANAGKYWIRNLGENISWNDAQTACEEGTHLATIAELKSLYSSGDLKCQDGSVICFFWAIEESNHNSACAIYADDGILTNYHKDDTRDNSYSSQVLCLGK